jgi:hypothetical protein
MAPFLTFLTPTYRRPKGLAACLASVQEQTAVERIQQIVIVDHVGRGIGEMFSALPTYAPAVQGQYVHVLCDDDLLWDETVVETVERFAADHDQPPLIIVTVVKNGAPYPRGQAWPPVEAHIDLGCLIVRRDVWVGYCGDYGTRYEGDFDFAKALFDAGIQASVAEIDFLTGAVSRGVPE